MLISVTWGAFKRYRCLAPDLILGVWHWALTLAGDYNVQGGRAMALEDD